MAVGFGLSIDDSFLNDLKEADKWIDKIYNNSNKLKASTVSAFKTMSEQGVIPFVNSLKQQKKVMEEIGNVKNVGNNALLTNLQKDAKRTVDEINNVIKTLERTKNFRDEASGRSAITFANSILGKRGDKTIDNLRTALRQLEEAQNRQNLNTKRGQTNFNNLRDAIARVKKELDNATGAANKFKNSNEQFMAATRSLRAQLSLLYSVSKVTGYIDKMVRVRKEFELQHKSMQVLLRDKDEADKLWQQTIDLAVKSPYRVSELVRYTKQLAAYRIETEKLHDTTKMLSDVSAGLGVDMQRLILAYGQVRAANYLRGTELRQFTEAGIPLLDELAQMFTEVEGRAVRAGDVFARISKRMVTFKDVEKVFKRMTSESGVFYNMQEEQSKTLHGMISNLHDSVDLMLNDIGRSNDGTIKHLIALTRNLVDNWRATAVVIKQVGVGLALLGLSKFASGWRLVATEGAAAAMAMNGISGAAARLRVGLTSLAATIKANPIFMLVGAVTSAGYALWEYKNAIDAANKKYDEMSRREARRIDHLEELKAKTKEYNAIINDSAKSEQEAQHAREENTKIINELKSKYPDVFSSIIQQTNGTLNLAEAIDIQNQKLITNIALQQQAKGGFFQDTQEENYKEAIVDFGNLENKINDVKVVAMDATAKLTQLFHDGFISEDDYNRFSDLLRQLKNTKGFDELSNSYNKLTAEFVKSNKSLSKHLPLLGMFANKWVGVVQAASNYKGSLDDLMDNFENQKNTIRVALNQILENNKDNEQAGKEAAGAWIEGFLNDFGIIDKNIREWAKVAIPKMVDIKVVYPEIKPVEESLLAWQKTYNEMFQSFAGFVKITQSTTKQDDVIERLNAQIKETEELITRINNAGGIKATLAGGAYEGQDLHLLNQELEQLKQQQQWFGEVSKKNSKTTTDNIQKQISLIKEMHKQYNELNKEFDDSVAKEKVMTSYAEAFKEVFEEAGISMTGRIIDEKALENLKNSGKVADDVVAKIQELSSQGTHIRSFSEDFITAIQYAEGFLDKATDIGDGKWTIGYGETRGVKEGDTITKEQAALKLRNRLTNDFVSSLNRVLDANKDIILTQEQYNTLLDLTYQGGAGATKNLITYAKNEEKAILHIQSVYEKVKKTFSEKEAERFGEAFVNKFKEAESIYDRIALLLQTMNLTVKGGQISDRLYQGMQKRSDERAAVFATGKEISDIIRQASIEISQINIENAEGVVNTLKKLIPYAKSIGDKALEPLLKAIAEFESEIELSPKIKERENIEEQIESMFGNYEVTLEMQKLNMPSDLAKKIFNFDSIELGDLREKALDIFGFDSKATNKEIFDSEKFKQLAEKRQKLIKDTIDKIDDLEDKNLKERFKKYTKYLIQAQGERVKIKMEEARKLSEIETLGYDDAQLSLVRQSIKEETQKELDKLSWEEFKDSGMYVQLFEDLEYASTKSLKKMREQLIGLKDQLKSLDADDLKHLYSQIEKLEEQLAKRNPYKTLITGVDDYIKAVKESKRLEDEIAKQDIVTQGMNKKEISLSDELKQEKAIYDQMSKSDTATDEDLNKQRRKISFLNAQMAILKQQLIAQGLLTDELSQQLDKAKATRKTFEGSLSDIGGDILQVANALPNIAADMENVFGAMDAKTRDTIDSISTIGAGIGDAIQGFASGNYIQAIAGVAQAIGAIFAVGDKKKERQIQKEIELVDKLGKAYEKLQQKIEDAYSINTLQQSGKNAKANLEAQIASYRRMISAEEDKKKTDKNRIKEWEYAIEDIQQQIAEMNKDLISTATAGIMDSVLSASQEFTNAWLEAFQETGNGLSGLEDNFKETMLEMVKQQAAMLISQSYVERWKKQLEKYVNPDDLELSTDEAKKWVNAVTTSLPQLNQALENYFNAMQQAGVDLSGGTGGELSGLQRGIQGVTEETAQIIEAYLNSIRFFVAENNTYLSQIASAFSSGEVENPMVSQLRIIAQQTSAINNLLNSLTKSGHSLGGVGLKVFIS